MGFLAGRAIRTEEKRLRPFFTSTERLLTVDVCRLESMDTVEGERLLGRQQVSVALTSESLFVRPVRGKGEAIQIAVPRMLAVERQGPMWAIGTATGRYVFSDIGRPMGGGPPLCEQLHALVDALTLFERLVKVRGGQVRAWARPLEPHGRPKWMFAAPDRIDLSDPAVRSAVNAGMADVADRFGAPFPP